MQSFQTNDRVTLRYLDTGVGAGEDEGSKEKPWLILIHGFTGTSRVWQKNIHALSKTHRVIVPDLRGHGESDKPKHGYHVSRLAMDLKELMSFLDKERGEEGEGRGWKAVGGSLGCAILWSYAELFTTSPFTHIIFVDQCPLQNSTLDGWDSRFCNRGMNTSSSLASLQTTLSLSPSTAHLGTISACLSYLSHPLPTDTISPSQKQADQDFFLGEAVKGNPIWYGKLMGDHTGLDWRDSIRANWGKGSGSQVKVLVLASERSGCFPKEGVLKIVEFVNEGDVDGDGKGKGEGEGEAKGVVVNWGGHWMYWEDPDRFDKICLDFLEGREVVDV